MLLEVQAMKCTLLRLGKDISIRLLNLLDAQGEGKILFLVLFG